MKKSRIYRDYVKRILDVLFSVFGILIMMALSLIIKIANLLNGDKGDLFFKQTRVGKDGKLFILYKFRTMNKSDEIGIKPNNIEEQNIWDRYGKLENDCRITKTGKFLRKHSLDEIPQFVNVMKGEMSCIGPRPLVPGELYKHGGDKRYQSVIPGMTSWWGCNGRSSVEYTKRFELEYYYIDNLSFRLDVKCFFLTIKAIISTKGAM